LFIQAGIPTFDTPERAVRAFMDIHRFSKNIEMLQQIPSRLPNRPEFDRPKAKTLIKAGLSRDNGLLTEVIKDRAIAFPPLNRLLAKRLMEHTRVYQLLQGYRSIPPANLELLKQVRVSIYSSAPFGLKTRPFWLSCLNLFRPKVCIGDSSLP